MMCKVCGSYFLDEDTMSQLFLFEDVCFRCKKILEPTVLFEVFPMTNGEVYYYYLYDFSLTIKQKNYGSKYLWLIYERLLNEIEAYDIVVYIDDDFGQSLMELSLILCGFRRVFLFSETRQNLIEHLKI